MGETSNTVPPGGIGKLQWSDLWKGLIKGMAGLLVATILGSLRTRNLPDWDKIVDLIEYAFYFIIGYLGINAGTNNTGQLFKANQPTVTVPAKELDQVIDKAVEADTK